MLERGGRRRLNAPRMAAAAVVVLYLVSVLAYAGQFPAVSQDEPWIASSGYKLATSGSMGSDLFAGFHGMERHHFVQMPVYPLLEAAIFRVAGLGVTQMRALSMIFGLALLLVVYLVGTEVGGERLGALAVVLMVLQRLTAPTEVRPIGILLLDSARLNRYDIAVPVFGLAALWILLRSANFARPVQMLVAGACAGLSALSHLYGVFWLPALLAVLAVQGGRSRAAIRNAAFLVAGFSVVCLPWLAWIAANWPDYIAQMRTVGARFELFTPAFYISNVFVNDGPISVGWLGRSLRTLRVQHAGAWALALGVPVSVIALGWRAFGHSDGRGRKGESALFTVSAVQLVLFVALLQVKSVNYTIAIWPLGALLLAWLVLALWDRGGWRRGLAVAMCTAIALEGSVTLVAAAREAANVSSYDRYEQQIAACIPPGSLVLGFQHYWPGLQHVRYRSWLLPLNMTNPAFEAQPVPLDVALDRVDPAIILMDRFARQLFEQAANPAHPYHYLAVGFERYQARRPLLPRCVVRDRTYGTMEIYETRREQSEAKP